MVLLGCHDLVDKNTPILRVCVRESLLAHVGCKFVPGHLQHRSVKLGEDLCFVLRSAVFNDELNYIVLHVEWTNVN